MEYNNFSRDQSIIDPLSIFFLPPLDPCLLVEKLLNSKGSLEPKIKPAFMVSHSPSSIQVSNTVRGLRTRSENFARSNVDLGQRAASVKCKFYFMLLYLLLVLLDFVK